MSERPQPTPSVTSHRIASIAIAAVGHLLATTVFFGLFAAAFVNEQALQLIPLTAMDAQLRSDTVTPILILFGLAACAWALTFIVVQLIRVNLSKPKRVALQKSRGTIITETLIVLPVFLLLTFGLAQMAINSIAGLLTTCAIYEVTRTLAVWAPEEGTRASRAQIEEKARLVGAGVIAPAVPKLQSGMNGCNVNNASLQAMRQGMAGTGLSAAAPTGEAHKWSMVDGFDTGTFSIRGPAKLTLGFCNSRVTWTGPFPLDWWDTRIYPFSATFSYCHPVSMPLVGPIFRTAPGAAPCNWSTADVSHFTKTYSMTTYLTPNPWAPYGDPIWLTNAGGIQ